MPKTSTGPATVNSLAPVPVTIPSGCVKIDIQFFRNFFSCLQSGGRLLFQLAVTNSNPLEVRISISISPEGYTRTRSTKFLIISGS